MNIHSIEMSGCSELYQIEDGWKGETSKVRWIIIDIFIFFFSGTAKIGACLYLLACDGSSSILSL